MRYLTTLLLCLWGSVGVAQSDDRGLIVGFLEDQLSGAGREIRLEGFSGALSSRATLDELTIADDEGVWLTLRGVVLDWDRGALFRGALEVAELTAAELILPRLPESGDIEAAPEAEATPFRLPELPVSINIEKLGIASAQLGAPVLGQQVRSALTGALTLIEGEATALLDFERTDATTGRITLDAEFNSENNRLRVALNAVEAQGGLLGTLMALPGAPSVNLSVSGDAPLTDFRADIALRTDGQPRLAGAVTIAQQDARTEFSADINGDVTALFVPEYRDFFGTEVALQVSCEQAADGTITLDKLDLAAAALTLQGSATLAAGGVPVAFDLTGRLADPSGDSVLLPRWDVQVGAADVTARFDAARSENWTLRLSATETVLDRTAAIGM